MTTDKLIKRMAAHAKEEAELKRLVPGYCGVDNHRINGVTGQNVQIGTIEELKSLFPDKEIVRTERKPTDADYPIQYNVIIDGTTFFCIEAE